MILIESIFEALQSLSANKLRSALTILGIVIGVAAVIAMLAIGRGAQDSITGSIQGIGTNLLFVMRGGGEEVRNSRPLTMHDAEAIGDPLQAPAVSQATAMLQGSGELAFAGETTNVQIAGITPNYAEVRNETLSEGEFINEDHLLGRASVVLLGPETAEKLFGRSEDVTGETIRIEGMPFRVLGVLTSKGGSAFGSEDDRALIPLTTAQTRLLRRGSIDQVDMVMVQAASSEQVAAASDEISQILRQRHRTAVGADDFTVFSQQSMLDIAQSVTGVLTIFLGGVAAISLLVGGIGIMNIMLVSVTERTREIGLRKALGARRLSIIIQFLTESALLSLIGGIIGIMLGWLISYVVGRVAAASNAAINPVVGIDMILLATLFSTAVGLFFGLYPANRAASLQPVEALRYE